MTTSTHSIEELNQKRHNKTATADDIKMLIELLSKEAEQSEKIESQAKSVIASIKKANIDPAILTNLLAMEGLIILPKLPEKEEKKFIVEEKITTAKGRNSFFKVWEGRDMSALTGDALKYWTDLKAKGKDYFINNLTAEGKTFYKTEKGQQYIDNLFKA